MTAPLVEPPLDYAINDIPPEEDHDRPYRSGLAVCSLISGVVVLLVLAALVIKEVM